MITRENIKKANVLLNVKAECRMLQFLRKKKQNKTNKQKKKKDPFSFEIKSL